MKISSNCCQLNLTSIMPQKLSTLRYMQNTHIKSILFLNDNQFGLVRTSSVAFFSRDSSVIKRVITLPSQVDQVSYLTKNNQFYAYQISQKQLISFSNESQPKITCLYNFNENAVNIKHQWPPWVMVFQQSARIALVRKLYGQSLTVVFDLVTPVQRIWQFTCNQSSICKMDQKQYLVNYEQTNNKFNLKFVVYNCVLQQKYQYKIENIEICICKGVKLYDKIVEKSLNGESRVWMKLLIAVNYKIDGSGILLVNLLEGNNNHYEVVSAISNRNAEINTILNVGIDKNIQVLEYRFIPQSKKTCHFFANYQWDDMSHKLVITDDKQLQSCSFDHAFNPQSRQLATISNRFEKGEIRTYQKTIHLLNLSQYKFFDKRILYLQFLNDAMAYQNPSFYRQVLNLL